MARITRLEELIRQDTEGALRYTLVERLRVTEAQLRRQLRAPQRSETYAALSRCAQASAAAQVVIETLWRRYHGDRPPR